MPSADKVKDIIFKETNQHLKLEQKHFNVKEPILTDPSVI